MAKRVGILTSGGDCPGLNAAIRGVVKAGELEHGIEFLGFRKGFRGLAFDQCVPLRYADVVGILGRGGSLLGTGREKPHKITTDAGIVDMTEQIRAVCKRQELSGLVCIGGGGTQKNALRLHKAGINVNTLPKTIDNDIALTDASFGFDTAVSVATESLDRIHTTARSHDRIMVVEIMGHRAGWLALAAGIAGDADAILIPEIPYEPKRVVAALERRFATGREYAVVAAAEGALTMEESKVLSHLVRLKRKAKEKEVKREISESLARFYEEHAGASKRLTDYLEASTGREARLTVLGHVQRGGPPSAVDRLLATELGVKCAALLADDEYGFMVAVRKMDAVPVPLAGVVRKKKFVPRGHRWVKTAKSIGVSFGDE